MKKFLSIILMLTMLIAPVGAVSCFADGGQGSNAVFVQRVEQMPDVAIQASIVVDENGNYDGNLDFLGEERTYLGSISLSELPELFNEESIPMIDSLLKDLKIPTLIRVFGCCRAHVIFKLGTKKSVPISVYFYNVQGTLVRTIEKTAYLSQYTFSA